MNTLSPYPNLHSIILDTIKDTDWLIKFGLSCALWIVIRQLSQKCHFMLLTDKQKLKRGKEEFSDMVMSTLHALMVSVISLLTILRYSHLNRNVLMDQKPHIEPDNESFNHLYKQMSIVSAAYMILNSFDLLLFIPNPTGLKIGLIAHHLISSVPMLLVYPSRVHYVYTYLTALVFQVEFSTLFLNLKFFARLFRSKDLYFIAGIGLFVTYPFQRIFVLSVVVLPVFMSMKDVFYRYSNWQHWCFGIFCIVFVILFSSLYSFVMFKNPKKQIYLKTD